MNGKNDKLRQEDTTKITERCFYGEPASCSHGCPFFFDIRTFLTRARDGKWGLAYKLLRNATIFPGIVCEICPAPCENECQRALVLGDGAIAVREIEAACVRSAKDKRPESYHIPPKTQRIAVIGAGLFGLSAALNLAQKAYPVTVFERGNGALAAHLAHPLYERFSEEVALQFSGVADRVEWRFGVSVSGTDDPALAGYDAVVFAAGENGAGAGVWDASSIVFEKTSTGAGKAGNDAKACGGWTNTGRFFCGGALTGQDAMESIAYGIEVSKGIERWLMTGDREAGDSPARPEKHYLAHTGAGSAPRVLAASEGYTADEAMREAARCLFCDCRACFEVCEMLTKYNKRPQKIAIEAYTDTKAAPPFSACSLTRETYSCNLCGKCKEVCPVDVDQEKLFFMAREGRAETGKHPRAFHDFWLRDMAWHTDEEKGGAYFAAGTNYLFFPGCKLGSRAPQQVEGAALLLKERFGAGVLLSCCGAPAYWAGETALLNAHLTVLRERFEQAGRPVFVFACAYCMRLFSEFLPEIPMVSLYELLAETPETEICISSATSIITSGETAAPLVDGVTSEAGLSEIESVEGGSAISDVPPRKLIVYDPCMSRDFPKMQTAVRALAARAGAELTELPARERNRCCGFGGHMRTANPALYDVITEHRAAAGGAPYLAYCANCAETFALEGKACSHILDFCFGAPPSGLLSLQQKREQAADARRRLSLLYEGEEPKTETAPWSAYRVRIPDGLQKELDKRLMMEDDIRETVFMAETSGNFFRREDADTRQAYLEKPNVVFWVRYRPADGAAGVYDVLDAYSHRMHFQTERTGGMI